MKFTENKNARNEVLKTEAEDFLRELIATVDDVVTDMYNEDVDFGETFAKVYVEFSAFTNASGEVDLIMKVSGDAYNGNSSRFSVKLSHHTAFKKLREVLEKKPVLFCAKLRTAISEYNEDDCITPWLWNSNNDQTVRGLIFNLR